MFDIDKFLNASIFEQVVVVSTLMLLAYLYVSVFGFGRKNLPKWYKMRDLSNMFILGVAGCLASLYVWVLVLIFDLG